MWERTGESKQVIRDRGKRNAETGKIMDTGRTLGRGKLRQDRR